MIRELSDIDNLLIEKAGKGLSLYEFKLIAIRLAAEKLAKKDKNKSYLLNICSKMH